MVDTGILPNNMRFLSPECYTTFWRITIYSDTLHWGDITSSVNPLLIWTLLPNLTFYLIMWGFPLKICNGCSMPTEDAYSSGHLVLPHIGTCRCSNQCQDQCLLNLSCFRMFEFRISLGNYVLPLTSQFNFTYRYIDDVLSIN